jgi:hypothetical protein
MTTTPSATIKSFYFSNTSFITVRRLNMFNVVLSTSYCPINEVLYANIPIKLIVRQLCRISTVHTV